MNLNEHERFPTSYIDTNQSKDTAILSQNWIMT